MGGLDLLARAREHAALLPIVLATGFLDPEDEARITAMAGVAVILKPFGMREIAEVLASLRARAS
jgi:DNA-binding response OmpR family regulator